MPKPVALFDIDNTIYQGFSYFPLLKQQIREGLIPRHALDPADDAMKRYLAGELEYEPAIVILLDAYAKVLAGTSFDAVLRSTQHFFKVSPDFFDYARPLIRKLRATHDVIIVTGEPQTFGQAVAETLGAASYYSTQYEVRDGTFTGNIRSYLATRHEKHAAIGHLMAGHSASGSLTFGDSEGDIEMLRAATHAFCVNPTPGLKSIAEKHGWHVVTSDTVTQAVNDALESPAPTKHSHLGP